MLSDAVADQIAMFRKARGWNTERLADECARIGLSEVTASVLRNIESGRRNSDGIRRRTISVDELAGIAKALRVPIPYLLIPYPEHEFVDLFPGGEIPTYLMHQMFYWYSHNLIHTSSNDDNSDAFILSLKRAEDATRSMTDHTELLARHGQLSGRLVSAYQRMNSEKTTSGDVNLLQAAMSTMLRDVEYVDLEIIKLRKEMRSKDFPLPDLPHELSFLDTITEEEYHERYQASVGIEGLRIGDSPGFFSHAELYAHQERQAN
ncbi:helix-turn-helix domain-containing protein [Amycolatopsis thailandensis]|uniref:helix-turn-helix domain-containing protein n=1 Tax=Amycolatopsis thailandensis TaxID=589330 RepID=UPI00378ABA2C